MKALRRPRVGRGASDISELHRTSTVFLKTDLDKGLFYRHQVVKWSYTTKIVDVHISRSDHKPDSILTERRRG